MMCHIGIKTPQHKRPIHQYSEEALTDAFKAFERKKSAREAGRRFSVPKTTILSRLGGRVMGDGSSQDGS
ncbi:hypothetical protein NQ314_013135 [Rhamnusium bicolor]|uniref:HTH psq-type domain-containing protein n=1 Tax=Rhamnusium bicolor TaxID=1586634 RepID=A0AAV8X8Q3_9CUCU|nr:hypothetical protein NQ314_013135 [Rhamnusium bicolor]